MMVESKWSQALAHLVLSVVLVVTVIPLLIIWVTAFKTNQEVFANILALPRQWQARNLAYVWTQGSFGAYFRNSVVVAVPVVLLVLLCTSLASFGVVFSSVRHKDAMFYFFLVGMIVPVQALVIPLFYDLAKLDLINTFHGLILVEAGVGIPFGIFLLRSFFRDIPRELVESARIDGARDGTILARIIAPLGKSGLLTLGILQFLWSWNELLLALISLHKVELQTIPLGLMRLQGGKYTLDYVSMAAGVLISSLPIIVVFMIFQRRFVQGLTSSALKG